MEKTFPASVSAIGDITEAFERKLKDYQISANLRQEYVLLIEEVATKTVQAADKDASLTLSVKRHLGTVSAKITCPGRAVRLESESGTDFSGQIIKEYSEYLRQSYSFGTNEILFTTSFSSDELLVSEALSGGAALLVGLLLRLFVNPSALSFIGNNVTLPVVLIFVRAMQTVAVPVAFFSLAYFVVKIRRTFDRDNKTIYLGFRYFLSSVAALAIGALTSKLFEFGKPPVDLSLYQTAEDNFIGTNIKDFLSQIVSSNMVEPFLISNPIPVLINALLVGLAVSSVFGRTGDTLRHGLAAFNDLFSCLMNIIYSVIPFFLFFAVLDFVIKADKGSVKVLLYFIVSLTVALLFLFAYYILRLVFGGVPVKTFFEKYHELLVVNFKIASNVQSYPYNKRILTKKMTLSRDYLAEGLKLGTLLNMDGNSLVVSVLIMNLIATVGVSVTAMQYAGIVLILFLFSVGAPNEPGSLLLGAIILMSFIGISVELVGAVLILEALFSKIYSFINAAGDIVTLAIEDERHKRKTAKASE